MSTDEDTDSIFDEATSTPGADGDGGGEDLFGDVDEAGVSRSPRPASGRGTVKIGKTTFAVGLIWQTASSGNEVEAEAKLAAKDDLYKANTYCIRETAIIQYGLGQKAMGHRPGMRALAAVVADKLTGNWLAAFEVGNDIYLAAVRDGQILSDYDRLLTQVREARDLFGELLYSAEWDTVLAPASWGVDEADPSDLDAYLDNGRDFRLKASGANLAALALMVGVAGIAAGGYVFMQPASDSGDWGSPVDYGLQTNDPLSGKQRPDAEAAAPIEQAPTPPWVNRPNGIGMLIACTDDIKSAPLEAPGWETDDINCSESGISLVLSKTRGTVLWAQDYFLKLGHRADFGGQAGSDSLRHTYPASFVSPYTSDVETQSIRDVERYLGLHFEELGQTIEFQAPQRYSDSIIDRYYERGTFSFETDLDPVEFVEVLSPIPALLIDQVSYGLEDGTWTVDGQYYYERPTPIPPPPPEGGPAQN